VNERVRTAAWGRSGAGPRHGGLSQSGERLGSKGQKFQQNPMGKEEL